MLKNCLYNIFFFFLRYNVAPPPSHLNSPFFQIIVSNSFKFQDKHAQNSENASTDRHIGDTFDSPQVPHFAQYFPPTTNHEKDYFGRASRRKSTPIFFLIPPRLPQHDPSSFTGFSETHILSERKTASQAKPGDALYVMKDIFWRDVYKSEVNDGGGLDNCPVGDGDVAPRTPRRDFDKIL